MKRESSETLPQFFQRLRVANGLTLNDIAQDTISAAAVSRFENKDARLSASAFWTMLSRLQEDMGSVQAEFAPNDPDDFVGPMNNALMIFNTPDKEAQAWPLFAQLFDQEKAAFARTGLIHHKLNYYMLIRILAAVNTTDVPDVPTIVKESQAYFDRLTYFSTYDLIILVALMQWYAPITTFGYIMKAISGGGGAADQPHDHWIWVLLANTLTFCNINRQFDLGERIYAFSRQIDWPVNEAEPQLLLYDAHMCARYGRGERGQVEEEMDDFLAGMRLLYTDWGNYLGSSWHKWQKSIQSGKRDTLAERAKNQIYYGDLSRIPQGFHFYYDLHPFDPFDYYGGKMDGK